METVESFNDVPALTHRCSHLQQMASTLKEELRRQTELTKTYAVKLKSRDDIILDLRGALHKATQDNENGISIPLNCLDEMERDQQQTIVTFHEKMNAMKKDNERAKAQLTAHYVSIIAAKDKLLMQRNMEYTNSISMLSGDHVAQVESLVHENMQMKEAALTLRQDITDDVEAETSTRIQRAIDEVRTSYTLEVEALTADITNRRVHTSTLEKRMASLEHDLSNSRESQRSALEWKDMLLDHQKIEYGCFVDDLLVECRRVETNLRDEISNLTQHFDVADRERNDAVADARRMNDELVAAVEAHSSCEAQKAELNQSMEGLQKEMSKMQTAYLPLSSKYEEAVRDKARSDEIIRNLKQTNISLEQQVNALEAAVAESLVPTVTSTTVAPEVPDVLELVPSVSLSPGKVTEEEIKLMARVEALVQSKVELEVGAVRLNRELSVERENAAKNLATIKELKETIVTLKSSTEKLTATAKMQVSKEREKTEKDTTAMLRQKVEQLEAQLVEVGVKDKLALMAKPRCITQGCQTFVPVTTDRYTHPMTPENKPLGRKSSSRRRSPSVMGRHRASFTDGAFTRERSDSEAGSPLPLDLDVIQVSTERGTLTDEIGPSVCSMCHGKMISSKRRSASAPVSARRPGTRGRVQSVTALDLQGKVGDFMHEHENLTASAFMKKYKAIKAEVDARGSVWSRMTHGAALAAAKLKHSMDEKRGQQEREWMGRDPHVKVHKEHDDLVAAVLGGGGERPFEETTPAVSPRTADEEYAAGGMSTSPMAMSSVAVTPRGPSGLRVSRAASHGGDNVAAQGQMRCIVAMKSPTPIRPNTTTPPVGKRTTTAGPRKVKPQVHPPRPNTAVPRDTPSPGGLAMDVKSFPTHTSPHTYVPKMPDARVVRKAAAPAPPSRPQAVYVNTTDPIEEEQQVNVVITTSTPRVAVTPKTTPRPPSQDKTLNFKDYMARRKESIEIHISNMTHDEPIKYPPDIPDGLDSGDVILFDRRCLKMSPWGCVLCSFAKIFANWDHVGIIHKKEDGSLWVLEANFNGVTCRPLLERIQRSQSHRIATRQLNVVITQEIRDTLQQYIDENVGRKYKQRVTQMFSSFLAPPDKQERAHLHKLVVENEVKLDQVTADLNNKHLTPFQYTSLMYEKQTLIASNIELGKLLRQSHHVVVPSVEGNNTEDAAVDGLFCSELVAGAYQVLGLLDPYPNASSYQPVDYSSDGEAAKPGGLVFNNDARLGPETYISTGGKKKPVNTTDGVNTTVMSPEVRDGIFQGFRRTPLYDLIGDDDRRMQFVKCFRRRVVRRGNVIFQQGADFDGMYFVESGSLHRYVGRHQGTFMRSVSTIGPGNCFGISAGIYGSKRNATVKAAEDCVIWQIDWGQASGFIPKDRHHTAAVADHLELEKTLRHHFIFKLRKSVSQREVSAFFKVTFQAGDVIWEQGAASDSLYVIKSGEVERIIDGRLSNTLRAGQSFGEIGVMFDAKRAATMRARTDCEVWALSAVDFHKLEVGNGSKMIVELFHQHGTKSPTSNEREMTFSQFVRFLSLSEISVRQKTLLLRLVTNNKVRSLSDSHKATILFWDYIRLDILINQNDAKFEIAFRLADADNNGRISFLELQTFLQETNNGTETKPLDPNSSVVKRLFGPGLKKNITYDEFCLVAKEILPPWFQQDVAEIQRLVQGAKPYETREEALRDVRASSLYGKTTPYLYACISMGIVGAATTCVFYPLERAQILRQVRGQKYQFTFSRLAYQGVGVAALRCLLTSGLYTVGMVAAMSSNESSTPTDRHPYYDFISACFVSGVAANTITYPLEVIRVIQASTSHALSAREALAKIRTVRGLYRGYILSTLGMFPFIGVNWAMYYELFVPLLYPVYLQRDSGSANKKDGSYGEYCIPCAVTAVVLHTLLTYPLDTIRRQQQSWHTERADFGTSWRRYGRGLPLAIARVVPAAVFSVVASRYVNGFSF